MSNCYVLKKEKLLAVLRLQKTKSIGDILAKKLISVTGDVEQIFEEKEATLQKINGIGSYALKHLFDNNTQKLAEIELEYLLKNNIEISYFLDDDFPVNLSHCIDGPILFFKDGNINFKNERIISIVGTRNMTSYGKAICETLIENLTVFNPIIVSGFAYGVDICAHQAAIKNNLQTIAVLAHGFDQIYPKRHKKYMRQVIANGGFITEFFHDENPLRENFLKRNRIVAGISQATIVIESAMKGGSLVTADIANSYNRDVFAVAGRNTDTFSKGCNHLIKTNQAALITSVDDIANMLNWKNNPSEKLTKQHQLFVELTNKEQEIVDYLLMNGKEMMDAISKACKIPIYKLAPVLLQMELKGVIRPLPGKLFEVI